MSTRDRRTYQRIDIPFRLMHASFQFPGIQNPPLVQGEIINVSAIGVLFRSPCLYEEGGLARIEIKLGSWDDFKTGYSFKYLYQSEPFVALGRVQRCRPVPGEKTYEVAVKFVSVDEGHQNAVAKFIHRLIQKKKVVHENIDR